MATGTILDDLKYLTVEEDGLTAHDHHLIQAAIAHGGTIAARHEVGESYTYTYTEGGQTITVTVGAGTVRRAGAAPEVATSAWLSGPDLHGLGNIGITATRVTSTDAPPLTSEPQTPAVGATPPGSAEESPGTTTTTAPATSVTSAVTEHPAEVSTAAAAVTEHPAEVSTATAATHPATPAPAAGVTAPVPPVPGTPAAARIAARRIGEAHGEFRAWSKEFLDLLNDRHAGVSAWDRMSDAERTTAAKKITDAYNSLPKLPKGRNPEEEAALQQGFAEGGNAGYSADLFMNRAVWAAAQLLLVAIAHGEPATPLAIGSFGKMEDCTSHVAARLMQEMTGTEVPAEYLLRTFGLPRSVRSEPGAFKIATAYARKWFAGVGVRLAESPGGFREGGPVGRYVLFMGDDAKGHVVFGEVAEVGLRIIDDQGGTRIWNSVWAAERGVGGLELQSVWRVERVEVPF